MLLTLNCEESTRLMSEEFHRDLTALERWSVRLHGISCRYCRRIRRQWAWLQRAARKRTEVAGELDPEARRRILAAIQRDTGAE
jgi:hypothetical protein